MQIDYNKYYHNNAKLGEKGAWPRSCDVLLKFGTPSQSHDKNGKLENVAIANALQLEAARRRAVPIRFNTSPVASLKSLSLSVAVLERIYC